MSPKQRAKAVAALVALGCHPSTRYKHTYRTPQVAIQIRFVERTWARRNDRRIFASVEHTVSRRTENIQSADELITTIAQYIAKGA